MNIIDTFARFWFDPSHAVTPDGQKVLSFLLNLVSCVCALPPENEPVFHALPSRLIFVLGDLCSAAPELCATYPQMASTVVNAMRAMLGHSTTPGMVASVQSSLQPSPRFWGNETGLEHGIAERNLLPAEEAIAPTTPETREGDSGIIETNSSPEEEAFATTTPERAAAIGEMVGHNSGTSENHPPPAKEAIVPTTTEDAEALTVERNSGTIDVVPPLAEEAVDPATVDRAALTALFDATDNSWYEKKFLRGTRKRGGWYRSHGWGASYVPIERWCGVSVNREGRVREIDLPRNNLSGASGVGEDVLLQCVKRWHVIDLSLLLWYNFCGHEAQFVDIVLH